MGSTFLRCCAVDGDATKALVVVIVVGSNYGGKSIMTLNQTTNIFYSFRKLFSQRKSTISVDVMD